MWNFLRRLFASKPTQKKASRTLLSPKAEKLILDYEVGGGKSYYNRFLNRPTWPGASSGVTIGIGYDLGYNSEAIFRKNWAGKISIADMNRLARACRVRGTDAKIPAKNLNNIVVPWSAALAVYREITIPKFIALTLRTFPGADRLHPDAFGALVSLVFNRGSSVKGKRRREMLCIRALVLLQDYRGIAREVISMCRLWNPHTLWGLHLRRRAEAALIDSCS